MPLVKEWMICDPAAIAATATVREACEELLRRAVGSLIILDPEDESPIGIFTKSDLLKVVASGKDPERFLRGDNRHIDRLCDPADDREQSETCPCRGDQRETPPCRDPHYNRRPPSPASG